MRVGPIGFTLIFVLGMLLRPGLLVAQQTSPEAAKEPAPALSLEWAQQVPVRSIGPANMSGRIVDLAINPQDPMQWWAATASGGLLRTDNNGATFTHQFDKQATVSIGAMDVSASDPTILWIGTGEENPRNSSSWGDGVYKSTDGGETWTNMGLNKIFQTGAVLIHPTNPDVVFIGALGRLWGPSEDRGLYKTTDGGKTWNKVLYVDDRTGVMDIVCSPTDPNIMLAATYTRMRDGYDGNDPATKFGPGAGIWRSTDGGETWERVTEGLPTTEFGRVGLCFYEKDPNFVYAVIESKKIGQMPDESPFVGIRGENAELGARITEVTKEGPAEKAGLVVGDIVLRVDDEMVLSYNDFLAEIRRHSAGETVTLTLARDGKSEEIQFELAKRPEVEDSDKDEDDAEEKSEEASGEGEKAEADAEATKAESENDKLDALRRGSPFAQSLGGQNPNMTDQQGPSGNDYGGVYRSSDGGVTWTRINSVNPRPMYYSKICVDPSDNNYIWVLGTELYISEDGGETFRSDGAGSEVHTDHHAMWIDPKDGRHVILGCDGGIYVTHDRGKKWDHHNHVAIGQFYHVGLDTRRAYNVYGGLQDNGSWGGPSLVRNESGPVNTDWFRIGGGDGFVCLVDPDDPNQLYYESQNGAMGRRNLSTGESGSIRPRPPRGTRYRFNWKTPFILSPHNSEIHFSAGNYVFRSIKKGDAVQAISPEITRTDEGSGSAIGQSPVDENILYAGTTDGMLWVTLDGGVKWTDLWNDSASMETRQGAGSGPPQGGRGRGGFGRGGRGPGMGGGGRGRGGQGFGGQGQGQGRPRGDSERQEEPAGAEESTAEKDPPEAESATEESKPEETKEEGSAEETATEEPAAEEQVETEKPTTEEASTEAATKTDGADEKDPATPAQDPLSGTWTGQFDSAMLPAERSRFRLAFKLGEDGKYSGEYDSSQSNGVLSGGTLNVENGKFTIAGSTSGSNLVFAGTFADGKLSGTLDVNDGAFSVPFSAARSGDATNLGAGEASTPVANPGKPLKELVPKQMWVSSIEPSKFLAGRCYVTLDGHRSDVDGPFVLVTENNGKGWTRLDEGLPAGTGSARVIREDIVNRDLLYLGTEFGLFVSIDRGKTWTKFGSKLPTVAVHEIAQHPTAGEIVIATHGRSLWIAAVSALRQWTTEEIAKPVVLYEPAEVVRWQSQPQAGDSGTRRFVGENPSSEAQIFYSLAREEREIEMEIRDLTGRVIQRFEVPGTSGLHKVEWNLRRRGSGRFAGRVENGEYLVALIVDGKTYTQPISIVSDPEFATSGRAENEAELLEMLYEIEEDGAEVEASALGFD